MSLLATQNYKLKIKKELSTNKLTILRNSISMFYLYSSKFDFYLNKKLNLFSKSFQLSKQLQ